MSRLAVFLCWALAIAPIAHIVTIIATTGSDNLSNDYLAYTGLIGDVLAGKYDWSHYFRDTFYRTHSVALPHFLHILDAKFFHWSIYPELYLGVALAALRLLLLHQACSLGLRPALKWFLLPVLSCLVFSASQISVYGFGDAALTIGLALFGFACGIWGLACRPGNPTALPAMLAGGLVASYSWGNGPVSWLVFLAALLLLGYRKPWHYGVWLGGFSLSLLPYGLFLQSTSGGSGPGVVSLFNWDFIVNALGWPFANYLCLHLEGQTEARTIGAVGIALALVGSILVWRARSRALLHNSIPAFLFMAHGLLSLWQISVFRSLIAAWYSAVAMSFWIGLAALALHLLQEHAGDRGAASAAGPAPSPPPQANAARAWARLVLVFLACAYLHSNLTYEDKTDYLFSRSPASSSALRNYRSAPTYAEGLLFQWGVGNPGLLDLLAKPLEKHQLSAFAPHQTWTLQGDFLLDSVKVHEHDDVPGVVWTTGTAIADRLPWNHFKHLNLFIAAPNVVTWTVELPEDLQSAEFLTAATISESAPKSAGAGGAWCKIDIRSDSERDWLTSARRLPADQRGWQPLKIDLSPYRGRQISIRLSVHGKDKESDWIVYQYPHIDIQRDPTKYKRAMRRLHRRPVVMAPSNTDRSTAFPVTAADDLVLTKDSGEQWHPENKGALDVLLSQYSHFWVKLAASPDIKPRVLTAKLIIDGFKAPVAIQIPLLADGGRHAYTYDLKLLELDQSARLKGLSIEPVTLDARQSVDLVELRFIRKGPDGRP